MILGSLVRVNGDLPAKRRKNQTRSLLDVAPLLENQRTEKAGFLWLDGDEFLRILTEII